MAKMVGDMMTRDPVLVKPETLLEEAIKIMAQRQIGGLPVVDESNKLVGFLSESDLMWRETGVTPPAYIMLLDSVIYLENPARYQRELHKALGQTVGEVMSTNPIAIAPDKPLKEAAKVMHDKKVHRFPVVDDNDRIIGVLTRGDIIRAMAAGEE